jgi:hypothetical protein
MDRATVIWLVVLVGLGLGGVVYKPISERIADKIIADEIKREGFQYIDRDQYGLPWWWRDGYPPCDEVRAHPDEYNKPTNIGGWVIPPNKNCHEVTPAEEAAVNVEGYCPTQGAFGAEECAKRMLAGAKR